MHHLLEQYNQLVKNNQLSYDPKQQDAIDELDRLSEQIRISGKTKGIYLFGPVGRGKSMLMDMFYGSLSIDKKQRLHFHHFMHKIHQQLADIQGKKDPLKVIAKQWAKHTKVLCFDEFFVKDIGDAMILAGLLDAFFKAGIIFVTTSNSHPTDLYKNGLQRNRFEPTIELLLTHCHVVSVSGKHDHRFNNGFSAQFYFENDTAGFQSLFNTIGGSYKSTNIDILNRPVSILGHAHNALLIDFMSLCTSPRATSDYIELATDYDAIFVQNIPKMGSSPALQSVTQGIEEGYIRAKPLLESRNLDDEARRFIALVDEFYDRKKLVVISSSFSLQTLYAGELLAFEFERTRSRLAEMQSWRFPTII
ncbi:cell division protein ZapE [Pseudoalteromonas sp. Of7M-16]|uniref:cell division protein ZapE n=1 Tax=Pseudoalteromonas sp. Of7M-16 TaxID=2917756 RepID=UPI001EF4E62E|nr:cell division protein ZapE [Pseudoalteromonas sp. Of7M-16]MCG7547946.1 AFG1 family ATPase [Pseudoalteromonas sp. Of7M-16]